MKVVKYRGVEIQVVELHGPLRNASYDARRQHDYKVKSGNSRPFFSAYSSSFGDAFATTEEGAVELMKEYIYANTPE